MSLDSEQLLQRSIEEHSNPGQKVEVILALPRDLTAEELTFVQQELQSQGVNLTAPVQIGATPEWENALRVEFRRPALKGYSLLPLIPIIGILGALGIGSFLAFKTGSVIESFGRNLVPLALITVGGLVLAAWVLRPAIAPTAAAIRGR